MFWQCLQQEGSNIGTAEFKKQMTVLLQAMLTSILSFENEEEKKKRQRNQTAPFFLKHR